MAHKQFDVPLDGNRVHACLRLSYVPRPERFRSAVKAIYKRTQQTTGCMRRCLQAQHVVASSTAPVTWLVA
jgi:hypothetical protein